MLAALETNAPPFIIPQTLPSSMEIHDSGIPQDMLDEAVDGWFACIDLLPDVAPDQLRPMERAIASAATIISALMVERSDLRIALAEAKAR